MSVYRDMDQAELDRQYNARLHAPTASGTIARYTALSKEVTARLRTVRDLPYGEAPDETLDLVLPAQANAAAVLLFVHGGQWQLLTKDDSLFAAPPFVERGVIFAATSFGSVSDVPLETLVDRNRRAFGWLIRNISRYGGDPGRIVIVGHSSGAHLAGMVAVTETERLKGAVLVSGLYDLEPVRLSFRNAVLKLDAVRAVALSPIRNLPVRGCAAVLATAEGDSAEFIRQASEFCNAWANQVGPATRLHVAGHDHFTLIETLADPSSPLGEATLGLLRRSGS
jgi:arylformamidase